MADEFLSGVQIGGNLANLGQMRAERMMQLRAQAALQAVQERHLAAQAAQISQQVEFAAAKKAKEDEDLANFESTRKAMTEFTDWGDTPPDQVNQHATQAALTSLLGRNPELALKIAVAQGAVEKPELAQQALQTRENIAQTQQAGALQRTQLRGEQLQQASETRAEATKYAADQRLKGVQQRLQNAGFGLEAAGKYAQQIATLTSQRRDAEEEGDAEKADAIDAQIANMNKYLSAVHPDKLSNMEGTALMTRHNKAFQAALDAPRNKALQEQYVKAKQELDDYIATHQKTPGEVAAPVVAPKKSSGFKVKVIKP